MNNRPRVLFRYVLVIEPLNDMPALRLLLEEGWRVDCATPWRQEGIMYTLLKEPEDWDD